MLKTVLVWLGFSQPEGTPGNHGHDRQSTGGHGHKHGVVDPTIATTTRGLWAIKWSFLILAITSAFQLTVVLWSGSVALLADTIHNIGDSVTAVPLWIAFRLARRKPSPTFTYGYGRVEDFAGVIIVMIILFSAIVAGYEAIHRLINPQPITNLLWVTIAGIAGFIGTESVAVFRIRVGREINSAALIADGYHARTDGLTSLAVVAGVAAVWLGFPLADPIIGLLITIAILGIVWQSAKAVFTRMLDGVEPSVTQEIRHVAEHVPLVRQVLNVRARWIGHRLTAELDLAFDDALSLQEAHKITTDFEAELYEHVPALASARIRARPFDPTVTSDEAVTVNRAAPHTSLHAPNPVSVRGELAEGTMQIIETHGGERMLFTATRMTPGLEAHVEIGRGDHKEALPLARGETSISRFTSLGAPEEPHEFDGELHLRAGDRTEVLKFRMTEPEGHDASPHRGGHKH